MTRALTALSAAIFSFGLLTAQDAEARQLSGDDIQKTIVGKTIFLKAPGGEFPLRYRPNGQVSGDGTALGLARFYAPRETGRWWIDGNQMCQQWPTWYRGRVFCFTLEQTGAQSLKWKRDDGRSGIARIQ